MRLVAKDGDPTGTSRGLRGCVPCAGDCSVVGGNTAQPTGHSCAIAQGYMAALGSLMIADPQGNCA